MTDSFQLTLRITDQPDGYVVVECLDLPGCVSQGESMRDALHEVADAIMGWYVVELLKEEEANAHRID